MSPWTGEAGVLADRIARFVDAALVGAPSEPFEALALDLHAWQVGNDPVLASLVDRPVVGWLDVPAVPIGLFRQFPVGAFRGPDARVFRTSGTTTGSRGEHHLRSTALYDRGAIGWARRCVPGIPAAAAGLLEDPALAPDSSLSHMVGSFGATTWHLRRDGLDVEGLNHRIASAAGPLFVAATGFSLADWLARGPISLPPGSVLMVTGGFKGREVALDPAELYVRARAALRPGRLVTEYGMTELSSQLWGTPDVPYLPPPWLRVVAVDPDGRPVAAGQRGQLRFYDLCNLDGTLAIETMDEGVVRGDGSVQLMGRLQGAEVRGCSLTVEEAWARRG